MRAAAILAAALAVLGVAVAGGAEALESTADTPTARPAPIALPTLPPLLGPAPTPPSRPAPAAPEGRKVLVIMEENTTYGQVFEPKVAPYLTWLAGRYATATNVDAGYPINCHSLAAYLLLTSGDRARVCDNRPPAAHADPADSVFAQTARAGRQWRTYAESMPANCTTTDAGRYVVHHVPATYYTAIRAQCANWTVPMGTAAAGAFHDDLTGGKLPGYSMLVPNMCDDMHGAVGCPGNRITAADHWLHHLLPTVFKSPDWLGNRLVVMICWDEGNGTSNHIPTLVLSPTAGHLTVSEPMTQCSMLALAEDVLALDRLGCAIGEPRRVPLFGLGP